MKTRRKLLSKSRFEWLQAREDAYLVGGQLHNSEADQLIYERELRKLVKYMAKVVNRELIKLFETPEAKKYAKQTHDANIASQTRIVLNKLTRRFEQLFNDRAWELAERAVRRGEKTSAKRLHSSLADLTGLSIKTKFLTPEIKTTLKAAVNENVALIKSIADIYLSKVQRSVLYSVTQGQGLSTIKKHLMKYEGMTERRAKNIARDQTRKIYNNLNARRMQDIGVTKFRWIHSYGGQKPRKDHIAMNGKVYSFDDLPVVDKRTGERGIPGQAVNCRCTMIPIFDFEDDDG